VVLESGIGADADGGGLASLPARFERGLERRGFAGEGGASLLVTVRERRELDASLRPFCASVVGKVRTVGENLVYGVNGSDEVIFLFEGTSPGSRLHTLKRGNAGVLLRLATSRF
jgi:hypothetical protein